MKNHRNSIDYGRSTVSERQGLVCAGARRPRRCVAPCVRLTLDATRGAVALAHFTPQMLRKRRSGEVVLASTSGTHSDAEGMSVTASRRASARSAYSASSGGAALPGSAHPDGGDGDAVRPKSSSSARSRPKSAKKDVNQLVGYQSDGLLDGNNSFIDLR